MCMTVSMSMCDSMWRCGSEQGWWEEGLEMATGMWMSIRCEYFDKWPDWTLKHFIWHVVDTMGREGGEDEVGWGFGHCVGQCVAFWSFIWTLVLFHCQLLCWLSRSTPKLSLSLFLYLLPLLTRGGSGCVAVCVNTPECVCLCVSVQPQTKGRLREHIMANDRLAKSQWTFVTELQNAQCQRPSMADTVAAR